MDFAPSSALVNLLAFELPAVRIPRRQPRKPLEFRRIRRGVWLAGKPFQVLTDQLIHACAECFRAFAPRTDGERYMVESRLALAVR
jgi:hypothetical protein